MNDYRDDDLDRLLFSLPLEETPAGLRESILASTIYRGPAFALRPWELWSLAALAAIAAWLCVLIVHNGPAAFVQTANYLVASGWRVLAAQNTWLWLLTGIGATMWFSLLNLTPIPVGGDKQASRR